MYIDYEIQIESVQYTLKKNSVNAYTTFICYLYTYITSYTTIVIYACVCVCIISIMRFMKGEIACILSI